MNFKREGSGPPVILIHGIGASLFSWRDVIPALSPRFTVYALDLIGFGKTPAPAGFGFTVAGQAKAVQNFLLDQHLPEPITVVGHSMGGGVCLELAVQTNRSSSFSLAKMVLIDAVESPSPPFPGLGQIHLSNVTPSPNLALTLARSILEAAFSDPKNITMQAVNGYAEGLSTHGQLEALDKHVSTLKDVSYPAATLAAIKTDTCVIWGENDSFLSLDRGQRLERELFKAKLHKIPNCGHIPQEENPAAANAIIRNFLG